MIPLQLILLATVTVAPAPPRELSPIIDVAKTLRCGMTRAEVRKAFRNVRVPDVRREGQTYETFAWQTDPVAKKGCGVFVFLDVLPDGRRILSSAKAACVDLEHQGGWGDPGENERTIFELNCKKAKQRLSAP